jgi:hypothetical protein
MVYASLTCATQPPVAEAGLAWFGRRTWRNAAPPLPIDPHQSALRTCHFRHKPFDKTLVSDRGKVPRSGPKSPVRLFRSLGASAKPSFCRKSIKVHQTLSQARRFWHKPL